MFTNEQRKVVQIDPDADPTCRDTIGNLMLVPAGIAALLGFASREERIHLLGVNCRARHRSFEDMCPECATIRTSILKELLVHADGVPTL